MHAHVALLQFSHFAVDLNNQVFIQMLSKRNENIGKAENDLRPFSVNKKHFAFLLSYTSEKMLKWATSIKYKEGNYVSIPKFRYRC